MTDSGDLRSGRGAVVVLERATEALTALHRTRRELEDRRLTSVRALASGGGTFPRYWWADTTTPHIECRARKFEIVTVRG